MIEKEKLCVFCKKLDFNESSGGDYPDPSTMRCSLGHWRDEVTLYTLDDFRKKILIAKSCPDYDEASKR